jgi:FAD/FMN-containing dehydrogenase
MVAVQSEFPSRWSNTGVSVPHSFVTPSTAQDIIQQISYAKANKLKIIPVGGGHGSFVPITDRTIYLSLAKFNSIELNEERGEVTIGGGCRTGDVLKTLAEKGWYTCTVNSNAVGMIGALLGGLNHSLAGKHGLGIDFIRSLVIIPFSDPDSASSSPATQITLHPKPPQA